MSGQKSTLKPATFLAASEVSKEVYRKGKIMIQQLAVYDESGTQIGMTFPKRARQLINKQRAKWHDDTHTSIQLLPDNKEEATVDYLDNDLDEILDIGNDDLLLYQAKKNVREKRSLIKHAIAYIATWPIIAIFYSEIVSRTRHPSYARMQEAIHSLDEIRRSLPHFNLFAVDEAERQMMNIINSLTHPLMYMIIGVMVAWGAWIIARVIMRITANRTIAQRAKSDPVQMEYQRLKSMNVTLH